MPIGWVARREVRFPRRAGRSRIAGPLDGGRWPTRGAAVAAIRAADVAGCPDDPDRRRLPSPAQHRKQLVYYPTRLATLGSTLRWPAEPASVSCGSFLIRHYFPVIAL